MSQAHTGTTCTPEPIFRHIVRTRDLADSDLIDRLHPLDVTCHKLLLPVGDKSGLTKTGIKFCRAPPNTTTTIPHWHTHEDEWYYIIEAGDNAVLQYQDMDAGTEATQAAGEIRVVAGDFIGFPAGVKVTHSLRSGDRELVYLVGGSREQLDICHCQASGKRVVLPRGSSSWTVNEQNVQIK